MYLYNFHDRFIRKISLILSFVWYPKVNLLNVLSFDEFFHVQYLSINIYSKNYLWLNIYISIEVVEK